MRSRWPLPAAEAALGLPKTAVMGRAAPPDKARISPRAALLARAAAAALAGAAAAEVGLSQALSSTVATAITARPAAPGPRLLPVARAPSVVDLAAAAREAEPAEAVAA